MKSKSLITCWLFFFIMISTAIYSQAVTITSIQTSTSRCQASGAATVTATGGTSPYLYSVNVGGIISPLQSSNVLTSLPAGTHTVIVTDAASISTSSVITISGDYQTLDFTPVSTDAACGGGGGATITANHVAATGRAPYTYELVAPSPTTAGPQAGNVFTGLTLPGTYHVRMTDSCGNFQTRQVGISAPTFSFNTYGYFSAKVGCDVFIGNVGINAIASGSTGPYSGTITNSNGIDNITIPTMSTLTVNSFSVTDYTTTSTISVTNGCGYTATTTIGPPPKYIGTYTVSSGCQFDYAVQYYYFLPPVTATLTNSSNSVVAVSTSTSSVGSTVFSGHPPGNYTVTIEDACGTDTSIAFTWATPSVGTPSVSTLFDPTYNCLDSTINLIIDLYNIPPPINTQILTGPISAQSTKPKYQYLYNYVYPYTATPSSTNRVVLGNLGPGTYTLHSENAACGIDLTYTVTINPSDVVSLSHQTSYTKGCVNNNTVRAGLLQNGITTPTPLYNNGFILQSIPSNSVYATASLYTDSLYAFNFLPSGTYVAKFNYSNFSDKVIPFCNSVEDTLVIPPYLNPGFKQINKGTCQSNGFIIQSIADTTKGVGPYSYSIIAGPQTYPPQSTGTFTFATSGIYTLLISDACGNSFNTNVSLDTAKLDVPFTGSACLGNTIKLHATTSPFFTYRWVRPNSTIYNGDTLTVGPITPADFGTYTVYQYVDINGCKDTVILTKVLNPSVPPTISSATVCAGTSTTLTATGATSYTWSPAVTCNDGSCSSVTASPTVNTTYTVASINSNLCAYTTTASIVISPTPTISIASVSGGGVICNGTTATITPSGATNYTLMPGNVSGTTFTVNPTSSTTYSITGESSDGCTGNMAVTTVTVSDVPTVTASVSNSGIICSGNTATITPGGATTYTLMPGGLTGTSFTVNPTSNTTYSITGSIGVCTGNEVVTTITITPTPTISITSVSNSGVICNGDIATITPSGASTYTLMPGNISGTTFTVNPSSNTTYTITGTLSSCTGNEATTTVTVNALPTIAIAASSDVQCLGTVTGAATVSVGGSTTYTVTWDGSATGVTNTSLAVGTHTAVVVDIAGCSSFTTVTISAPSSSLAISVTTSTTGCGLSNGSATITPSGGWNTAYTYTITNSTPSVVSSTNTATGLAAGSYNAQVMDANGCIGNEIFNISNPTSFTISATASNTLICSSTPVVITPSGGATSYTLVPGNLNSTGASFTVSPTVTTVYNLTGTSAGNCVSGVETITVTVNTTPTISIASVSNSGNLCSGSTATITPSGAFTYTLMPDNITGTSFTVNPTSNTTYSITGESASACAGANTAVTTITVNSLPTYTTSLNQSVCSGSALNIDLSTVPSSVSYTVMGSSNGVTGVTASSNASTITDALSYVSNPAIATYTVSSTSSAGCVSATPSIITVTVSQGVVITSAATHTICSGSSVNYNIQPSGGVTYTWLATSNSNVSGESTSNQTGATINDVLTQNTSSSENVIYNITGTLMGCPDATQTVTVTVYGMPQLQTNTSQVICEGTVLNIPITTIPSSTNYTVTGSGNGVTGVTASSNASSITDALTYVSSPATATYSVTYATAAGCSNSTPSVITVTVTQGLNITSTATHTICSGAAVNYSIQPNSGGITYNWVATNNTNVSGESLISQTGAVITDILTQSTSSNEDVIYNITGVLSGCPNATKTVTITVLPLPQTPTINFLNNSGNICNNGTQTSTITATGTDSYTWYSVATGGSAITTGNTFTTTPLTTNTTYYVEATSTTTPACTNTTRVPVSITVTQPTALTITGLPPAQCDLTPITNLDGYINPNTVTGTWQGTGVTGTTFTPDPNVTTYTLTFTSNSVCQETITHTMTVTDGLPIDLSAYPGTTMNLNEAYSVIAFPNGYTTYSFTVNGVDAQNNSSNTLNQTPNSIQDYIIVVSVSENGCSNSDTITVKVQGGIPNVFTPNSDGKNDLFAAGFEKQIINRWGDLLYEGKDGWDGKDKKGQMVVPGTYYYIIKEIDTVTKKERFISGSIEVLTISK